MSCEYHKLNNAKPLLIAAAAFELEALAEALRRPRGASPKSPVHEDPELCLTGIGALNAAKAAPKLGDVCRGREVIFVGTCGAFAGFRGVELICPTRVSWLPTGERNGLAYAVKDSAPPITLPEPPAWCQTLPRRQVLCGPSISLVATLPPHISPNDAVENLELYSCIAEISGAAHSLAVVLAVTNLVGKDAQAQWRDNFRRAADLTAQFVASHRENNRIAMKE